MCLSSAIIVVVGARSGMCGGFAHGLPSLRKSPEGRKNHHGCLRKESSAAYLPFSLCLSRLGPEIVPSGQQKEQRLLILLLEALSPTLASLMELRSPRGCARWKTVMRLVSGPQGLPLCGAPLFASSPTPEGGDSRIKRVERSELSKEIDGGCIIRAPTNPGNRTSVHLAF